MKVILSDVSNLPLEDSENCKIIYESKDIRPCIGCFCCWVKTPGQCILKDGYENMGQILSRCTHLIFISRCTYGSFSPFIKNLMDRSISYVSPYFVMRHGEMHHKRRYDNQITISVYFYGEDISNNEKKTAQKLIMANALNLDATISCIQFFKTADEVKAVLI